MDIMYIKKYKRRPGRPKREWWDKLDYFLKDWPLYAVHREQWTYRGEAFAQLWDGIG